MFELNSMADSILEDFDEDLPPIDIEVPMFSKNKL